MFDATKTIVQGLVCSRLDYCKSILWITEYSKVTMYSECCCTNHLETEKF